MEDKVLKKLNQKQLDFCKYFISEEFYGNGTKAYQKAYSVDYEPGKHGGSRLLRNKHICTHISSLLEEGGLNDSFVDKQRLFLITQMEDLGVKHRAIDSYDKLTGRIIDRISQVDTDGKNVDIAPKIVINGNTDNVNILE